MNNQFSFIIITYNEEVHLPRLLQSISGLDAPVFILDSGSTDNTLQIAEQFGAVTLQHAFENHPKQWDFALKNFNIQTPWVICLDADQIVTDGLKERLKNFRDEDHPHLDGIYFNRKNFFKGSWIKHGGYSPFYLLKMIRYGAGYSDLNENMDHRFIVPGKTEIWKDGYILEENLKENNISFWINKHNRYSDLVAQEEVERMQQLRSQTLQPRFWGSPDERTAWLKQLWWKMPRYARPMIYFIYRMFFQLGILDGRTGIIFHFLQAFWFRLIVDIKIDEILSPPQKAPLNSVQKKSGPLRFVFSFIVLFVLFYYFNILFFSMTEPYGRYYIPWLANHLNYISALRLGLLKSSAQILNWLGFTSLSNEYDLLLVGHGVLKLVYSCLGLGVISFFAAFVIAYPKKWKSKIVFLISGIIGIELLNITRFVLLALFWDKQHARIIDHHTLFNIFIYLAIALTLYFWVKSDNALNDTDAAN
ncbi:exosortase/archaeosortase family protein [Mucilaginibacter frigoritolerans]|uniref:Exosortase/archaeosortase family protein n=1 Tax=Mucilaginibacter frigoritolerans TaxID=652788 RepID=A0A562U080_9SPHI|nr:glycosyltransferase [Mucilaginibacter frigoritolerans]TWI99239.1 exosortase/archaeosortase family protein [Mucilaginibacter frigoritolerans]